MDTTPKGKAFEKTVFDYFSSLVKKGYLGLNPHYAKVYWQRRYYSRDRESYIIFDVAIEAFLPDQQEPFLIFLVECKDYGKNIPVDDIEEFSAKVSQVGKHNTKAIFVTTNGFQKSTLKYAKNNGIGLWRIVKNTNTHEIILNRTINRINDKAKIIGEAMISDESHDFTNGSIYIQTPLRYTTIPKDLIYDFLLSMDKTNPHDFFKIHRLNTYSQLVPYKSKQNLSALAEHYFSNFQVNEAISLDLMIKTLGYKLEQRKELNNLNIVGKLDVVTKTITIFGLEYYTLHQIHFAKAHEIAHILLNHTNYLKEDVMGLNGQSQFTAINSKIKHNIDRVEFQANYFAACLLLPEKLLRARFSDYLQEYGILNRGFSPLYIDRQPCNLANYSKIILPLAQQFNVSQETLKNRLIELGLAKFLL